MRGHQNNRQQRLVWLVGAILWGALGQPAKATDEIQVYNAGISMGFAEALSDDGSLTGRGSPWLRGAASGVMTAIGGLGHSLPYLVPDSWNNAFWIATAMAGVVVFFELWAIAFIRSRYMDTPFLQAVFQIVLGGVIVLGVGILIGAA